MGNANTHTALGDDNNNEYFFDHQKTKMTQSTTDNCDTSNHNNTKNTNDHDNTSCQKTLQVTPPNRVTRNITHTTNVTYDDAASLSTCATNSILMKLSSNDACTQITPSHVDGSGCGDTVEEYQQTHQYQRKLEIQRKMKHQQNKKSSFSKYDSNRNCDHGDHHDISGEDRSTTDTDDGLHHPIQNSPLNQFNQQQEVVGVMYAASPQSNTIINQNNNIRQPPQSSPYASGRIEEQDQWQNAWEEDTESSDDEDYCGCSHDNNDGTRLVKPTSIAWRNKSDSILTKKIEEALESGKNGVKWDKSDYEKPNIMMFFPLLRVLGKGSFGKVNRNCIMI